MKSFGTILGMVAGVILATQSVTIAKPMSLDKKMAAERRFKVLRDFDENAVLDRETGLVWTRGASDVGETWNDAKKACRSLIVGDRRGFRLPTAQEIVSLAEGKRMPEGHPFALPFRFIWTATPTDEDPSVGYIARMDPQVGIGTPRELLAGFMCVRGAHVFGNP